MLQPLRPEARLLAALPLLCALAAPPTRAQEEGSSPQPSEPGEAGEVSPSTLPPSDSPESTASVRVLRPEWHGVRRRVQTFLVPLDDKARAPTARVAAALEQLQSGLPQYEVVDLGRALKVDATP